MALLGMWIADRRLFTRNGLENTVRIVAGAAGMWALVQGLDLVSSPAGPGTVYTDAVVTRNNLTEVLVRTCIEPRTIPIGFERLLSVCIFPSCLERRTPAVGVFHREPDRSGICVGVPSAFAAMVLALVGIVTADRASNGRVARSILEFDAGRSVLRRWYVIARCGELELPHDALRAAVAARDRGARRMVPVRGAMAMDGPSLDCRGRVLDAAGVRRPRASLGRGPQEASGPGQAHRDDVARGARREIRDRRLLDRVCITFLTRERIILRSSDFLRIRTYDSVVAHTPTRP